MLLLHTGRLVPHYLVDLGRLIELDQVMEVRSTKVVQLVVRQRVVHP